MPQSMSKEHKELEREYAISQKQNPIYGAYAKHAQSQKDGSE